MDNMSTTTKFVVSHQARNMNGCLGTVMLCVHTVVQLVNVIHADSRETKQQTQGHFYMGRNPLCSAGDLSTDTLLSRVRLTNNGSRSA